ncbi:MAG: ComF family protein [Candidatus Doudnabacteria bacterium]|nr:ComF family protein [Candidatus Doudnabacteria bacterium]
MDGIISALPYSDQKIREIIAAFKYSFAETLAERLSALLIQEMKNLGLSGYFAEFKIIPVPLHSRRLNWRGFNQSLLLSKPLSRMLNVEIQTELVKRDRFTKPQIELKKEQRRQNIQGAFSITNPSQISGRYLLVDDVVTTGSTLNEIAKLLKQSGASEVWAMTLAHG